MSKEQAPYGRLQRLLGRLDFAWGATGRRLDYIGSEGLWMTRFRPGGPHALWIAGHLAYYEAGARKLYQQLERNPREDWKELFGNGSPCLEDPAAYPSPETVMGNLRAGREKTRATIAAMSAEDLDRPVSNERLAIRDVQSQVEFLIWHDAHHGAQLGSIISVHQEAQGAG